MLKVHQLLPDRILLKQGQYVQTCAHIEKVLWNIWIDLRGFDPEDPQQVHEALKRRKRTPTLRESLRTEIVGRQDAFALELGAILDQVDAEIDNRNMAVHGAWHMEPDGSLRCEYFKDFGTNGKPDWQSYNEPVREEDVVFALKTADEMLKRCLALWFGMHPALQSVQVESGEGDTR